MKLDLSDPAQRRKALLIPILVGGLVYVVFDREKAAAPTKSTAQTADSDDSATPQPPLSLPPRGARRWASMTLDGILAHNPFARPRPAPRPPAEAPRPPVRPEPPTSPESDQPSLQPSGDVAKLAAASGEPETSPSQLPPLEVIMVYHGPDGPAAVLGTQQIVRVGDRLEGYGKVLEIGENGIRVQPLNSH